MTSTKKYAFKFTPAPKDSLRKFRLIKNTEAWGLTSRVYAGTYLPFGESMPSVEWYATIGQHKEDWEEVV